VSSLILKHDLNATPEWLDYVAARTSRPLRLFSLALRDGLASAFAMLRDSAMLEAAFQRCARCGFYDTKWLHRAAVVWAHWVLFARAAGGHTDVGGSRLPSTALLRTSESLGQSRQPAVAASLIAFIIDLLLRLRRRHRSIFCA